MASKEERSIVTDFGERYEARDLAAARRVEEAALGTSCGANGYTTLAQAEALAVLLPLEENDALLDLGCGCGWPGLHLGQRYSCRVFGADLPLEGLIRARANAAATSTVGNWVRASARALPFRPASFDAIVHSDVLC